MEFSRPEYCNGQPYPSPGDLPYPEIEPRSPALQANSLPAEPQGKPKNTGVGSLSLLQWLFPIQESDLGLLHCRWILYQLSYQGKCKINVHKTVFLIFFKYWTKAELALSYLVPSQCYVRGFENWKAFINYAISSRFSIKHKFHI